MDDLAASQEQKAEELEESVKTLEPFHDDTKLPALITIGSESSSRKKGKRAISKRRRKSTSAGEEKAEVDPAAPLSPSSPTRSSRLLKLTIRPGEGSKGGGKKK